MKIIIELDHAVNDFDAEAMVENFNNEPWVRSASLDKGCGGSGGCKESSSGGKKEGSSIS